MQIFLLFSSKNDEFMTKKDQFWCESVTCKHLSDSDVISRCPSRHSWGTERARLTRRRPEMLAQLFENEIAGPAVPSRWL